jgi:hypothetical protein
MTTGSVTPIAGQLTKTRRLFCPTRQGRVAKIYVFPKDGSYD